MPAKTKSQLFLDIVNVVKSGGVNGKTTGASLRELFHDIIDTVFSFPESKGLPNGYASLDGNAKVPLTQIPDAILGQVEYKGTRNAAAGIPEAAGPGNKGHYYIMEGAGTIGGKDYQVGDWLISDGTKWDKVDNTDSVTSVFGRTGAVTLQINDIPSITASRVLVSDSSGKMAASAVASTTLGYLDATSSVQAQLNGKQPNLGFTPVQQGGGIGQGGNKVYLGWGTTPDSKGNFRLKATVDVTDIGNVVFDADLNTGLSGKANVAHTHTSSQITYNSNINAGAYDQYINRIFLGNDASKYLGLYDATTIKWTNQYGNIFWGAGPDVAFLQTDKPSFYMNTKLETEGDLKSRSNLVGKNLMIEPGNNYGIVFHASESAKIYMSLTGVGSSTNIIGNADYNMYFRQSRYLNRGWVFQSWNNDSDYNNVVQITGAGDVHAKGNMSTVGNVTTQAAFISKSAAPLVSLFNGYKSWIIHHANSNNLVFAPSGSVNGQDWNWGSDITFADGGHIVAKGNVTATSDARVKTNIQAYEGGLEKVLALRPVTYDRVDSEAKGEIGFIAQEVRQVEPALVLGDDLLSLDYSRMVVLLTQALQEQQLQINALKSELSRMQGTPRNTGAVPEA